jgi:6-phosphogluconolactonase
MSEKQKRLPRVHTYEDAAKTAGACARHIMGLLEESLAAKGTATLAVSGGTTPKLMFREMVKVKFDWNLMHLFFVDERMVPPTDNESNFKLAQENLIGPAKIPQEHVHRIVGELTPDGAAARYCLELQNYFNLKEGQLPHFDVIHQGTGPDAHTASLFPGDPLIEDREDIAAASYSEAKKNWRVTLLPGVLLAARHNVFLVSGEDKAEALRHIFEGEYNPLKYPAQVVMHHGHKVEWFLDRAAARLIEG